MKPWLSALVLTLLLCAAEALEVLIDQSDENKQQCTGMYSRSAWGGPVDPYINVMFPPKKSSGDQDAIVSVIIFEWKDEGLIGIREKPEAPKV